MKRILSLTFLVTLAMLSLGLTSCVSSLFIKKGTEIEVPLTQYSQSVPRTFKDIDKPVKVVVESSVTTNEQMYNDDNLGKRSIYKYVFVPSVKSFTQDATVSYMQQMRFDISNVAEYRLNINVSQFQLQWIDKKSAQICVRLSYRLTNEAGETIIPSTTVSSTVKLFSSELFGAGFGRAYADALNKINWDRIADILRVGSQPQQEKNAQVKGDGDTALEHTVIRWYILSAPQGADVSWRVVSSTPDVANTNSNFVGTTPYESTESFDIKGLTYDNSGNVQIEVTCEKAGYLTQRKRFNLRQAIDQKEISAKFNLIKDE